MKSRPSSASTTELADDISRASSMPSTCSRRKRVPGRARTPSRNRSGGLGNDEEPQAQKWPLAHLTHRHKFGLWVLTLRPLLTSPQAKNGLSRRMVRTRGHMSHKSLTKREAARASSFQNFRPISPPETHIAS